MCRNAIIKNVNGFKIWEKKNKNLRIWYGYERIKIVNDM